MDYLSFCRQLYSATGIPAVLYRNGHVIYSSLAEMLGIEPSDEWKVYDPDRNPEFASINPDLEYGHVRIEGTGYDLFLGPVFTCPVTEKLMREFFEEAGTPPELRENVAELVYAIPSNSHARLVRTLLLLHFVLNGKEADIADFYAEAEANGSGRGTRLAEKSVDAKENEERRSSYDFEKELYYHVQQGDTARLKSFLERTREFPSEGKLAHTQLRHAKNSFIGLVSKICVLAAIPGGIDPERAYQLADLYTLQCEQMQSIEDVHRLQYVMLMDFCRRCGETKVPEGVSAEISRAMTFIRNHTNGVISLDDVAAEIGRSTSYLMRRFKAELKMSVGDYITKCRLEEAEELLTYSDRSLAEISAYLGYSSQSYFQNVFRKQYGMTPMQYRRQRKGG